MRTRALPALAVLAALPLALTACGQGASGPTGTARSTGSPSAAGGPIAVTATDTECGLSRTSAPAGKVEFTVTNKGTKTNEFYIYAEGDRVMGEVENVAPGLSRTFHVELRAPGTYETACKPGMVGDGIRGKFTVTGSTVGAAPVDTLLSRAVADYTRYVNTQADEFLRETKAFVALVKAGKVAAAKAAYPKARAYWERIEPVAESFGDLDPKIDGREDVVAEGLKFTGYHRLEKDLWVSGLQKDSAAIADQLLADVTTLVGEVNRVKLNPLQLANGSKALLDEVATGKITGEEERYSHTDLWDFQANVEGSRTALAALRPYLVAKDPALVAELEAKGKALVGLLATHHKGDGFVLYTALTKADIKALTDALDAFAEPVATVAGLVAKG